MMWTGWADFPRWLSKLGIKGDASRANAFVMLDTNPINSFGFAFGTAFPHFVMDDAAHKNELLDFTYVNTMMYEARVYEKTREKDERNFQAVIDRAVSNGWLLSCFFHPVYIAREKACVEAIKTMLAHVSRKRYSVIHMGTDGACLWWHARNKSSIRPEGSGYSVNSQYEGGIVLRFPDTGLTSCTVDGRQTGFERRTVAGKEYLLAAVSQGKHTIMVS
jgi:hypothetical protein